MSAALVGNQLVPLVAPRLGQGGNISVTTANPGTDYTAFADQPCSQLTVINDTGTKIDVRQDGVDVRIPDGVVFTFFGLTNANQLSVRRDDTSNTTVNLTARWEA